MPGCPQLPLIGNAHQFAGNTAGKVVYFDGKFFGVLILIEVVVFINFRYYEEYKRDIVESWRRWYIQNVAWTETLYR